MCYNQTVVVYEGDRGELHEEKFFKDMEHCVGAVFDCCLYRSCYHQLAI